MSAHDKFDLGMIGQGVEDGIDLRPGDTEDHLDAGVVQALDDDLGDLLLGHCDG